MKDGESRGDDEIAVFRVLDDGLRQHPAATTPLQSEQLTDLVMLLHAWAERINLTAHRTPTRIAERLVLDAAALGAAVPALEQLQALGGRGALGGVQVHHEGQRGALSARAPIEASGGMRPIFISLSIRPSRSFRSFSTAAKRSLVWSMRLS